MKLLRLTAPLDWGGIGASCGDLVPVNNAFSLMRSSQGTNQECRVPCTRLIEGIVKSRVNG